MALLKTPICDFGLNAIDFKLKSINGELLTLNDVKGDNGTLIMFICNHCPYVKAIIRELADDCAKLKKDGINSVAIMSNDTKNYPEDSFENMKKFSDRYNFSFPYLIDETQEIAKKYDAACTPDFYLYDNELKLVYRGQLDDSRPGNGIECDGKDLSYAIKCLIKNIQNYNIQKPSIGCNIKWK